VAAEFLVYSVDGFTIWVFQSDIWIILRFHGAAFIMTITLHDNTDQILIKQIEEEIIDIDFVTGLSGERRVSSDEKKHIAEVMGRCGEAIYHDLLFALTLLDYPATQARLLWDSILEHQQKLKQQLQRDPGIVVTTLDFFTNIVSSPDNTFAILPQDKFESIIQRAVVDGLTNLDIKGAMKY